MSFAPGGCQRAEANELWNSHGESLLGEAVPPTVPCRGPARSFADGSTSSAGVMVNNLFFLSRLMQIFGQANSQRFCDAQE
jgi:hypothetical protein